MSGTPVDAVERIAAAADMPATTPEAERAKADAILAALAAERLLAPIVPVSDGGLGLTILDAARMVAAVARTSGSAALILAMHLAQVVTLVRHGSTAPLQDALRRLAARQALIASGTSEVGVGGDILRSLCRAEPDGADGFRLVKRCANVSYLDHAGAVLATAMHHDGRREVQRLILLEPPGLEIQVERENLMMGMRGIAHRAVTLEARFAAAAIFPGPFTVIARTMSAASHLFWAAAWSGLAAAALSRAEAAAGGDAPDAAPSPRLAAAADRLYAMHALIRDAAHAFETEQTGGFAFHGGARFNRLKIVCAGQLGAIVADCAAVAGLRGYIEGTPLSLSEIVRDSFSARIMVSSDRLSAANARVRRYARETI
jgi:acyl-CoA dehydrogenase